MLCRFVLLASDAQTTQNYSPPLHPPPKPPQAALTRTRLDPAAGNRALTSSINLGLGSRASWLAARGGG